MKAFYKLFILVFVLIFTPNLKAADQVIQVSSFMFTPNIIFVNVGDLITFQWVNGNHTTTCNPALDATTSLPLGASTWNAPMDVGNPTFSYRMTVEGTYNYVCLPHSPGMSGQIIVSGPPTINENFDYTAGDSLGSFGWVNFSGTITNRFLVTAPGLTFPGYPSSGIGNAVTILNTGQDDYKSLGQNYTNGSVYASMIVNVTTARTGDYFAAFFPSNSQTLFNGRVYVKDTLGGSVIFGLSKTTAAGGGIFYTSTTYSTGTSYLLVLKYTFNAGTTTDDQVSLFVFSSAAPNTEPAPSVGPLTGTATDLLDIGRFTIRQGTAASSPDLIIDGIRVSNSWNEAPLPVELSGFFASTIKNEVILDWATNSERNNHGFEIQRLKVTNEPNQNDYSAIGFVQGNGTSNQPHHFKYKDAGLTSGKYLYRLKQKDFNGNFSYFDLNSEVIIGVPNNFSLSQNFPNPFNPQTRITFELPFDGIGDLTIYDVNGREIRKILLGNISAGFQFVDFSGEELSSGVYFYRLNFTSGSTKFTDMKKMMLLK
ncbi:hypothetical protein BH10BAC5_BH10BAC5_06890 [soil metagenome]